MVNKKCYWCPSCGNKLNASMFCSFCCSTWATLPRVEDIQEPKKDANQLADEHWGYIEALLKAHEEEFNIKQIEFHYKSAFIHGYKHAMEDK